VWLAIVSMEPDEEFQVKHIRELVQSRFDESVSEQTVRAVLRTLREEGLVKHSDDGKYFIRTF
jgi:predicted transcriptional regulator